MKVGFVVECGPGGADEKVLRSLIKALRSDIEPRFVTSGSKRVILEDCGKLASALFDNERCDKVFVVWDLMPCNAEHHHKGTPSCVLERAHVLNLLRATDKPRTILLCIKHELEAWLLADGSALEKVLKPNHQRVERIPDDKSPEQHPNPKKQLGNLFKKRRGLEYNDTVHAVKIIEQVTNFNKLVRAPSFARFKQKLQALR